MIILLLVFIQGLFEWCDAYYSIAMFLSIIMLSGSHVLEIWLLPVSKEHATFKNILWNIHKGGNSDDALFRTFRNDFLGYVAIASCLHSVKITLFHCLYWHKMCFKTRAVPWTQLGNHTHRLIVTCRFCVSLELFQQMFSQHSSHEVCRLMERIFV